MVQQSYSGIVLMDTNIVLGDFDKDRRCEVVVVSERGFEVQKGFVVIAETVFGGALVVGDVSERVVESS
jgi:hypothetical protein